MNAAHVRGAVLEHMRRAFYADESSSRGPSGLFSTLTMWNDGRSVTNRGRVTFVHVQHAVASTSTTVARVTRDSDAIRAGRTVQGGRRAKSSSARWWPTRAAAAIYAGTPVVSRRLASTIGARPIRGSRSQVVTVVAGRTFVANSTSARFSARTAMPSSMTRPYVEASKVGIGGRLTRRGRLGARCTRAVTSVEVV